MSDAVDRQPVDPIDPIDLVDDPVGDPIGDDHAGALVLAFPSIRPAPVDRPTEPPLRDVIGEVLRDERLDQQRTLAEVAREAAVSLPYLSEIERGRKEVSSDVLAAICDALQLPLADVLGRSAERLRPSLGGGSGMMLLAA